MADFPRIKWLNVDGQQVPFTEPQHFTGSGDETVRTGHDNPLPVANYTQDENGIWLPVSKDNPMPTQVTGSIAEHVVYNSINIADGLTATRRITLSEVNVPTRIMGIGLYNVNNDKVDVSITSVLTEGSANSGSDSVELKGVSGLPAYPYTVRIDVIAPKLDFRVKSLDGDIEGFTLILWGVS